MSNQPINNKFIILSGANGGIGSNILSALLFYGYKVIALDISDSNIKNEDCFYLKCDISNRDDLANISAKVRQITDKVYAIINAVGIFKMESLIEGSEEDFRKIFEINFFGIYSLNKNLIPLLEKSGKVINLTSEVAKYSPQPFQAYYNISKIALDSYNDALRREANYIGIKVIKIQSGSMKTSMLKNANDEYDALVDNSEHFKKPLTKFKYMMDRELKKQNNPSKISKLIIKILKKNNAKICYRIKNSFKLSLIGHMPEAWQDSIYKKVIK